MITARFAAVLFPEGPLCFRGLRVCADGFGPALATAFSRGEGGALNDFRGLCETGCLGGLLDVVRGRTPLGRDVSRLGGIERLTRFKGLGFGLERALYELNKALPCQSPKVKHSHVDTLRDLVAALDKAGSSGKFGVSLVDRHMAAFMARQEEALESSLRALDASVDRQEAHMFEMLKLMASLQEAHYPHPLKNIAAGFQSSFKRAIEQFKSKSRKKQVLASVNRLLEQGNLIRLSRELDLRALRALDRRQFGQAVRHFDWLTRTIESLERSFSPMDHRVAALGNRYAAMASALVLLVVAALSFANGGMGV
jgi:hypothetical protein